MWTSAAAESIKRTSAMTYPLTPIQRHIRASILCGTVITRLFALSGNANGYWEMRGPTWREERSKRRRKRRPVAQSWEQTDRVTVIMISPLNWLCFHYRNKQQQLVDEQLATSQLSANNHHFILASVLRKIMILQRMNINTIGVKGLKCIVTSDIVVFNGG